MLHAALWISRPVREMARTKLGSNVAENWDPPAADSTQPLAAPGLRSCEPRTGVDKTRNSLSASGNCRATLTRRPTIRLALEPRGEEDLETAWKPWAEIDGLMVGPPPESSD